MKANRASEAEKRDRPLRDGDVSAFVGSVFDGFEAAARARGRVARTFEVAGRTVRLEFAGEALAPALTAAFAHLPPSTENPSLTLRAWDSASTGIKMAPAPWRHEEVGASGRIPGFNLPSLSAHFHFHSRILSLYNHAQRTGVFWIRDAARLPFYEEAYPFVPHLHWWLQDQGLLLLHAGAVGTREGGVLLGGKGGSGKSVTSLACLSSSLQFLSDDHCVLDPSAAPRVFTLYSAAKLHLNGLVKFPELGPFVKNADRLDKEKGLLFLKDGLAEKLVASFPVRAILLPAVTASAESKVVPISSAEGIRGMAPSTIAQSPGGGETTFRLLSALVRGLPCFRLEVGTDVRAIPPAISRLLAELRA